MKKENDIYSKHIIDIADIIFANPTKEVSVIVSELVSKCHKSERTIWRWIKKAQKYNKNRLKKQEKARNSVLSEKEKEAVKSAILSRNEALEILGNIAKGNARKVNNNIMIPTDADRTRAIQQLAKMEGWEAPAKVSQTDSKGNDIKQISPKDAAEFIAEITKKYSK